jgi:hypothetical protein
MHQVANVYEIIEALTDDVENIRSMAVVSFNKSGEVYTYLSEQGPPLTAFAGLLLQNLALEHASASAILRRDGGDLAAE